MGRSIPILLSHGSEVVKMYKTLLECQGFKKGMDIYFKRQDGQVATCEYFFAAMRDAKELKKKKIKTRV